MKFLFPLRPFDLPINPIQNTGGNVGVLSFSGGSLSVPSLPLERVGWKGHLFPVQEPVSFEKIPFPSIPTREIEGDVDRDVRSQDAMASPPRVVEGGAIPFACDGGGGEEDEDWIFGTQRERERTEATSTVQDEGRVLEPVARTTSQAQHESEPEAWMQPERSEHEENGPVVEDVDALPPGWVAGVDPQSGYTYYWNAHTGVSTWDRPGPIECALEPNETPSNPQQETRKVNRNGTGRKQEPNLFVPGSQTNSTARKTNGNLEERCPHGRSAHTCVAFGFGGRVYTVRSVSRPGSVQVDQVGNLLRKHRPEHVKTMESFPSPACWEKGDRLAKYANLRATECEAEGTNGDREAEALLWKLLQILCTHKGELRSKGGKPKKDLPEKALADVLCPQLGDASWAGGMSGYSVMNPLSGESAESAHTASSRVQDHLIRGELDPAIQLAQESGLWSVALVLAQHAGDATFKEVASEYARRAMKQGSPLQVLSLLLAGSGGEVRKLMAPGSHGHSTGFAGKASTRAPHLDLQGSLGSCQGAPLLSDWRKAVSIIAANRVDRGEEALVAIGDALWSSTGQCSAAQLSYIVGGMPLQPMSQEARLCLVGADHRRFPRTFASNEAIQRTEIFEAAILLGFPQSLIACFQPYKIMYAYRLVEAGFPEKALRYCHAVDKILKKSKGHSYLVERTHEQLACLTERLTTHLMGFNPKAVQESGPGGVLGGLGRLLDKGVNMLIGGDEVDAHSGSTANSTHNISSGGAYQDMQSDPPREGHHRRTSSVFSDVSIADSETSNEQAQRKVMDGSFMRSLSSKALGLFGSSRTKHEEVIGEENKFYFDEKLGIWREQGKDVPQEEEPPPPPPTSTSMATPGQGQNWHPHSEESQAHLLSQGSGSFGSHVQRSNVRSRYVDAYAAVKPTSNLANQGILPGHSSSGGTSPSVFIPTVPRSQSLSRGGADGTLGAGGCSAEALGASETTQMGLSRSASAGHSAQRSQFAPYAQNLAAPTTGNRTPQGQNRPSVHWQPQTATAAHPEHYPYAGAPSNAGHGNDTNQFKDVQL